MISVWDTMSGFLLFLRSRLIRKNYWGRFGKCWEKPPFKTRGTIMSVQNPEDFSLSGRIDGLEKQVSELQKTEASLKSLNKILSESEEKFRRLFDMSGEAMMVLSEDGIFLDCNSAALDLYGCKEKNEFVTKTPADFSPENQPDGEPSQIKAQKVIASTIRKGSGFFEWTHKRKNGELFSTNVLLTQIHLKGDSVIYGIVRDISAPKKIEEQIVREKIFSETLLNSLPGILYMFGPGGKIVRWNENFERVTQYSADEISRLRPADFISTSDREQALLRFKMIFMTKERAIMETRVLTKHGHEIPYLFIGTYLEIDGSAYVMVTGTDLTELKKTETMVQESQERFHGAFISSSIGMAIVSLDGRWIEVNHSLCEIVGYSEQELFKKAVREITRPDDIDLDADAMQQLLSGLIPNYHIEKRYIHRKGHEVWVSISISLVRGEKETPDHFVYQVQDIGERKRYEEMLRQAKEYAELLFQSSPSAIFTVDRSRRITSWNKRAEEITGYRADEIMGKECLVFAGSPCDKQCRLFSGAREKSMVCIECRILTKQGEKRFISKNTDFLRNETGKIIGGIESFNDVTVLKRMEEDLRASEQRYRTLVKNIPLKIFYKDINSVYLLCNEQFAQDLKVQPAEIKGKTDDDFFSKEMADKHRADDLKVMSAGEKLETDESYFLNGQEFFIHTLKTPVKDTDERTIGVLGIFKVWIKN